MQHLAKNQIILFASIVFIIFLFFGGFFLIKNTSHKKIQVSPQEITDAYKLDLHKLQSSLQSADLSKKFPEPFMSNFLQMAVPYQYKENHLNAFFALQKLVQLQKSGQEVQASQIQEILDRLINL